MPNSWEEIDWLVADRDPVILEECREFTKQLKAYLFVASPTVIITQELADRIIHVLEREASGWNTMANCNERAEQKIKALETT